MYNQKAIVKIFSSLVVIFCFVSNSVFAKSRNSAVRTFGDIAQIANPVIVAGFASQEKGAGHFGIIYGQTWLGMHGIKLISKQAKWRASKRPHIAGKKDRYEGMPSAHTGSAWVAAAYMRTFSDDYKLASIPLYAAAAVTGYSRIKAKEHTLGQVIAGALFAEGVVYLNSKLGWSNEYRSTDFHIGAGEASAGIVFKF